MSDRDITAGESSERRGGAAAIVLGFLVAGEIVALPFVPLLLSLIEASLLHTDRVEEACRTLGIHDELSALYQGVFELFS